MTDHFTMDTTCGKRVVLGTNAFLVFIDETGEEEFRDVNYPVFGLGGCAVQVGHYRRLLETPWNFMKERFFEGADEPFHACELCAPSRQQVEDSRALLQEVRVLLYRSSGDRQDNPFLAVQAVPNSSCVGSAPSWPGGPVLVENAQAIAAHESPTTTKLRPHQRRNHARRGRADCYLTAQRGFVHPAFFMASSSTSARSPACFSSKQ